jgi:hypothetical protein
MKPFPALLSLLVFCTALPLAAAPPLSFALRDLNGVLRQPLDTDGAKAVALIFITDDCPISNGYAPEINRLQGVYAAKGIDFRLVSVDTSTPATAIKQHAHQYGYRCPDLLDPKHLLAKRLGATVTPEAFVFGPTGKLLYQGRIDDKYADFGKVRFAATTHDLQAALDAVVAGRTVPHPLTKAVGCYI